MKIPVQRFAILRNHSNYSIIVIRFEDRQNNKNVVFQAKI